MCCVSLCVGVCRPVCMCVGNMSETSLHTYNAKLTRVHAPVLIGDVTDGKATLRFCDDDDDDRLTLRCYRRRCRCPPLLYSLCQKMCWCRRQSDNNRGGVFFFVSVRFWKIDVGDGGGMGWTRVLGLRDDEDEKDDGAAIRQAKRGSGRTLRLDGVRCVPSTFTR